MLEEDCQLLSRQRWIMKSLVIILAVVCGATTNQPNNTDFSYHNHSDEQENRIVYPEPSQVKILRLRPRLGGPEGVKPTHKPVGEWVFDSQLDEERIFKAVARTPVKGSTLSGKKSVKTGMNSTDRFHSGTFDEELDNSSESAAKS